MTQKTAVDRLLEIASPPTGTRGQHESHVPRALTALYRNDGFFAFESALEVFPVGESCQSYPIVEWNRRDLWIEAYGDLAPEGLCFAQDLFGTQFLIADKIYSFDPETAETVGFAESIEEWADRILADYQVLTAQPLAHAWQVENGRLPARTRLVPITPFVLGGPYDVGNLMAIEAVVAMRLRASLALQIRDLPDGAEVIYKVC